MSLIVLFGLPGTGKTHVGKIFEKYFDYFFYDGDRDLTPEMKKAIKTKTVFTDRMRDVFFNILIKQIYTLSLKHKNIVVAQTFIKEKYRIDLIKKIPEVKFVLVETKTLTREKRLERRVSFPLERGYARQMVRNFEKPEITHQVIINGNDGEEDIKKQIRRLIQ